MIYETVVEDIKGLSYENLITVSEFVQFLKSKEKRKNASETPTINKATHLRTPGGFPGDVVMSEDFFETPGCFKEYV